MSKKITEILESMCLRCQENNNSTKNKVLMWKHAQLLSRVRLFNPRDCCPPGSWVHEIFLASILEELPFPPPKFWHEAVKCSEFKQMQILYFKWYDDVGINTEMRPTLKCELPCKMNDRTCYEPCSRTYCLPGVPFGAFVQRTESMCEQILMFEPPPRLHG